MARKKPDKKRRKSWYLQNRLGSRSIVCPKIPERMIFPIVESDKRQIAVTRGGAWASRIKIDAQDVALTAINKAKYVELILEITADIFIP